MDGKENDPNEKNHTFPSPSLGDVVDGGDDEKNGEYGPTRAGSELPGRRRTDRLCLFHNYLLEMD